uniref:LSM14 domain-containing protein n=1 Tax=Macrostomum lignano TaxID=282301 RepID=A0A1I8IZ85_9PLAT
MAAPIRRPRSLGWPYAGGYEKLLHLEIKKVLYTGSQAIGHILDPGSVQIVVLKSGCACAPLKLNQQLIFVGYNSYLENVWNQVVLLPSNSHYKCKIKRAPRQAQQAQANRMADRRRQKTSLPMPLRPGERLTCSDIQRANRRAQRRQQGGNFWRRRDRTAV